MVLQVQEHVNGYTLEKFGQLFQKEYPEGYGERTPGEKQRMQKMALRWFEGTGVRPDQSSRPQLEKELTKLVTARLMASYVHFHFLCGVVHDDMHTGNILLTADYGHVKAIAPPRVFHCTLPSLPHFTLHTAILASLHTALHQGDRLGTREGGASAIPAQQHCAAAAGWPLSS